MLQTTIRLLIIHDSSDEAERLISMLQNAGKTVRATHIDSAEALNKLIQEKIWDLLISTQDCEALKPAEALKLIRKQNKDIPMILLTDDDGSQPCVEGLKIGARDVVKLDEDQHLLLVIDREIHNGHERDVRRTAERRLRDIARHNQQLLDSSRDAIAFIQDGMFLYTNDSFAEQLKYKDRDDLECLPVIDMVSTKDHDKLKSFLKNFTLKVDESETIPLELIMLDANDQEKSIKFDIRKSIYDDESCVQLLCPYRAADTEVLQSKLAEIKNLDPVTKLYNKTYLLDQINALIDKAEAKEFNSALFHINIDNFEDIVQEKLGVSAIDPALALIAEYTKTQIKKTDTLCRYSESSFILVAPKINPLQAEDRANTLATALQNHIVSVGGKTLQFKFYIGISVINETSSNTDTPIEHSIHALEQARAEHKKDGAVFTALFEAAQDDPQNQENGQPDIQTALAKGRFKLLYQPILSLRGSEKEHYEVLLRMLDKDGTEISPKEFLKDAADIKAATKIDRWVILEATKTLSSHRQKGNDTHLIVHLSKDTMLDNSLAAWLSVVFKTAKLPPECLIFQLNETDVTDHLIDAKRFIADTRKVGCGVSINHFGCALNPFKTLDQINANYIKIDGSFTQDLQTNETGVNVLNDLISTLHQSDKITIVPFVESASLLSKLWQSGVHYIQGYYLQGPTANMDYDFDMES